MKRQYFDFANRVLSGRPASSVGLVVINSEHFDHALVSKAADVGHMKPTRWYDKTDVWTTDALQTLYRGKSVLGIELNSKEMVEGDDVLEQQFKAQSLQT